ncbi:uncharacterized protein ACB058_006939 isoform 2-T2 [Synchiropus picturatus]
MKKYLDDDFQRKVLELAAVLSRQRDVQLLLESSSILDKEGQEPGHMKDGKVESTRLLFTQDEEEPQHIKTEADGGDCGGPEPDSDVDTLLHSDHQLSFSSESDTDDSEDWRQSTYTQSASKSVNNPKVHFSTKRDDLKSLMGSECGRECSSKTQRRKSCWGPLTCSVSRKVDDMTWQATKKPFMRSPCVPDSVSDGPAGIKKCLDDDFQRKVLEMVRKAAAHPHQRDVQLLLVKREAVPIGQQERSSSLDPERQEPGLIKEGKEESARLLFTPVSVKTEDDEEPQHIKTEDDGGDSEGPEPVSDVDTLLHSGHQMSLFSESDTDDSEDWREITYTQPAFKSVDNPKAHFSTKRDDLKSLMGSECGRECSSKTGLTRRRKSCWGPLTCSVSRKEDDMTWQAAKKPFMRSPCVPDSVSDGPAGMKKCLDDDFQRKVLEMVRKAATHPHQRDVQRLQVKREAVPIGQQERSSSLDPEGREPGLMKERKVESTRLLFTPVSVKTEDKEEPQHIKTEADGGECGEPEPDSDVNKLLHSRHQMSLSSESDTDDSEDWRESSYTQPTSKFMDSPKVHFITKRDYLEYLMGSECGRECSSKTGLTRRRKSCRRPLTCSVSRKEDDMTWQATEKPFMRSPCVPVSVSDGPAVMKKCLDDDFQRKELEMVRKAATHPHQRDVQQLQVKREAVPIGQQESSSSLDPEGREPGLMKEGKAESTGLLFTPVSVKTEDKEEPQHIKTEADGGDCGGPEPDCDVNKLLHSHHQLSLSSESDTDNKRGVRLQTSSLRPLDLLYQAPADGGRPYPSGPFSTGNDAISELWPETDISPNRSQKRTVSD